MNELACRAYRAAQYPPSYTAAPTLNSTLRLSLTLSLMLQTPRTLNYRRAARHPNRLRSQFCTKTRSSTAHQPQVHNKSYKWSVGFNVNGRRSALSRPSDVSNGIHTSHHHTDGAHVCQTMYTISKDVRHSLKSFIGAARREGRFGASSPHPASPSLSF